jgi:hypothetical protein
MNKIIFIHKYWRKLFRNHIDRLTCFVGWSKDHWFKRHRLFTLITDNLYNIDNALEYFIRNGKAN